MWCLFVLLTAVLCGADSSFEDFVVTFHKDYPTNRHRVHAEHCFHRNLKKIDRLNRESPETTFGITTFADLCEEDFQRYLARKLVADDTATSPRTSQVLNASIPADIDWRKKNAVTSVKSEGECGMTWAFSAVASMEGQHAIHNGQLIALSEQEIGTCDKKEFCCDGGWMGAAFEWVIQNGGIDSFKDWPYVVPCPQKCDTEKAKNNKVAKFGSWTNLPTDEKQIQQWVALHGPVSIAVYADPWQFYKGGILSKCARQQVNHGATIVGYQTSGKKPYWIVKNMWGSKWGIDGYIYLEMFQNECNMKNNVTTVCVGPPPCKI